MITSRLDNLVVDAAQCFHKAGYTDKSVKAKADTWGSIVKLHKKNGYDYYNQETINYFIDDAKQRYSSGIIGRTRYSSIIKSVQYLSEFYELGEIKSMGKHVVANDLSPAFKEILESIRLYPEWGDKTKRSIRKIAMPYMKWLQSEGYDSFERVTDMVIRSYMIDFSSRATLSSVDAIRRGLKKFHRFLYKAKITTNSFEKVLTFSTPPEHKIIRPVPNIDIAAVLSVIDRTTVKGKRDYAIILLAVVLGLRAVDITELQFSEIDWVNGEIKITQEKTQKTLALPLTKDVGLALQDYILNGRPISDEPYIFLTIRNPLAKMSTSNPYEIFKGYQKIAGVQGGTFHGLRRALGTNMVIEGIPVTTVAQVLGHSSIEPTKQYISLDSEHLKAVALSLNDLPEYGGDRA